MCSSDLKDLSYVYVAGAKSEGGQLVSSGGRVVGITERGETLREAIDKAYASVARIGFENGFYRKDIGKAALTASEEV